MRALLIGACTVSHRELVPDKELQMHMTPFFKWFLPFAAVILIIELLSLTHVIHL